MTKEREAIRMALEALHGFIPYLPLKDEAQCGRYDQAITAIKEALAQPEQEPVAWMYPDALCDKACLYLCTKGFTQFPECANTTPQRTWVGLTKYEHDEILITSFNKVHHAIKLTQDKLKEKNT